MNKDTPCPSSKFSHPNITHRFLGRKKHVLWKEFSKSAAASDSEATSDQVLVEPVSFTFDTIELGSMIVCGLPASPHDLVHESDARRRLLRVPR